MSSNCISEIAALTLFPLSYAQRVDAVIPTQDIAVLGSILGRHNWTVEVTPHRLVQCVYYWRLAARSIVTLAAFSPGPVYRETVFTSIYTSISTSISHSCTVDADIYTVYNVNRIHITLSTNFIVIL